jgi:G:T/U-mismatch repair DNA glycosylase
MEKVEVEYHPWNYYAPANAKTLIIGTFPSAKKNWSFDFFYPNKRNVLWSILATLCEKDLVHMEGEKAVLERKEILDFLQIAITDMGKCIERKDGSSLDEQLTLNVSMDILYILDEYPTIKKIILTSSSGKVSALKWFAKYLLDKGLSVIVPKGKKPLSFILKRNNTEIEVHILYSPSPRASNRISFPKLIDMYRHVIII